MSPSGSLECFVMQFFTFLHEVLIHYTIVARSIHEALHRG
nr:MAG TPA: hypothetical protein [Caudoviricetes sp.]